jgi:hypothetical protein
VLLSCAREVSVVVIIIVVVGVDVSVGVGVVVRTRTRIAHLQSERPARRVRGHRWSYGNTSDRCIALSHVSISDEKPDPARPERLVLFVVVRARRYCCCYGNCCS